MEKRFDIARGIILMLLSVMVVFACVKDDGDEPDNTTDPCPETFSYQGKTYHGVMIGSQCWMKKSLDYETGNSSCYGDNPENCETFGRMYDWHTIMNGALGTNAAPSGVRGICPEGWHVPSDREWQTLEGTVDSQSGVNTGIWTALAYRGHDAGLNLKSKTGWDEANGVSGGGTDAYGFAAHPGGFWNSYENEYLGIGKELCFWTCTEQSEENSMFRQMSYAEDRIARYYGNKTSGFYVRCVKD